MQAKKNISIIIVNYKKYELTQRCVYSVLNNLKDIEFEIIIIDNNSPNDSYRKLLNEFKNNSVVKIIKNKENLGFGMANNIGVKQSIFNNILLLNPDVVVFDNSIEVMIEKLLNDIDIGLIGCKLLNKDRTLQYSCRRFLKLHKFLIARTPLKKLFSNKFVEKFNNEYLMKDYNHKEENDVDWVMGSCILLRKSLFNQIGGFSKEYFMYFEDVDLCYKIHKENKRVLYYPKAQMIHLHQQESIKKLNKLTFIHFQSMIKFYKKSYGLIRRC